MTVLAAACASLVLYLTGAAPSAQAAGIKGVTAVDPAEIRRDTPSGLPVPRIVSLKSEETYCRSGPTFSHPVRLTFMRQGLPVMIVAETRDHWRKIRDPEGDECWTHKSKLSGELTALVLEDGLVLRARPDANAPAKANLGRGVIARVDDVRDGWLKVSTDGIKGWANSAAFWGAGAPVPISRNAATHN
jgi:SH3-like domain-containing protein